MSDKVNQVSSKIYIFCDFRLDIDEQILVRKGTNIPLTPKAFQTLTVLVENAGRLLEKSYLMDLIWEDRFVEETNLTFNIRTLRKALGDNASDPIFIETVPRRGYRFISKVERVIPESSDNSNSETENIPRSSLSRLIRYAFFFVAVCVVVVSGSLMWSWVTASVGSSESSKDDSKLPLFKNLNVTPITATGGVRHAVISPDGKYIVYLDMKGKNGIVWLRESATGSSRQIVPLTDDLYVGFSISSDSRFLYFGRRSRYNAGEADIYRMPLFGGPPTRILSDTQGWVSISPDGTKIGFVRCPRTESENCSLWIAESNDGSNAKKLVTRTKPFRIAGIAFSPDGLGIAFANGQSNDQSDNFKLSFVNLKNKNETDISEERFFNIAGLAWLPSGKSLLITAARMPDRHYFLRHVEVGRRSEVLPNTLLDPATLSLDRDGKTLVATTVSSDFELRLVPLSGDEAGNSLANAMNAAFSADGRILFASGKSGVDAIWSMDANGSDQRQLTSQRFWESKPIGDTDGRTIYFSSNRTGEVHVWKMNSDGSNQTQVTKKNGGFSLLLDPKEEWLYYHHGITRHLWRVSLKSGEEQNVLDTEAQLYSISSDAKRAAYTPYGTHRKVIRIASIENGKVLNEFELPDKDRLVVELGWLTSTNELVLISADADYEGNVLWICSADGSGFRKIAELGDEKLSESSGIGVSPDGKKIVFAQGNWKHDAVLIKGLAQ